MWRPSPERVATTNLVRFAEQVGAHLGHEATEVIESDSIAPLHEWSIREPSEFWSELWDFCDVRASQPATEVVDDPTRMPGARWFSGSRLNFAENLLADRHVSERRPEAIVAWNEDGPTTSVTWADLRVQVAHFAAGLQRAGVAPGDRVAGFLPNIPEAVIAMLATSSLGAMWSSSSPDFGVDGVLDRFSQIEPKVLVCARGAMWNGSWMGSLERVRAISERLPSLGAVVVADYGGKAGSGDLVGIPHAIPWNEFASPSDQPTPDFAQLPFDHPLYVLYSSGTTGIPKCIVHGQGGTLIQHLKEHVLHCDLRPGDTLFYYTTCGWMMWNWMVSALASGVSIVLYDGSPFQATPTRMWDVADAEHVHVFGTSAKYLALAEKEGLCPRETHDLSSLRTILSTGSPLLPQSFDWVYGRVKADVHLASIAGGTDLVACLVGGNPTAPVYRGEIQAPALGMSVEVWDSEAVELPPGQQGELVCTRAFPSVPVRFWNDPDDMRFRAAYFEHTARPAWRHGDWIERTAHGGFVIHGRSDATLNPGGVRIGTAEIYRQVERLDEIVESVAVGQQWDGDERIVLFVVLRAGVELDDELRARIRSEIKFNSSPRHIPKVMLAVPAIPRTISGKISEIAVRRAIHGLPVENADALANPESLAHFQDLVELQG